MSMRIYNRSIDTDGWTDPVATESELRAALEDAIAVCRACKAFGDEQGNRYFLGDRPNWKKAALAVIAEIDDKPDEWAALLETPLVSA